MKFVYLSGLWRVTYLIDPIYASIAHIVSDLTNKSFENVRKANVNTPSLLIYIL